MKTEDRREQIVMATMSLIHDRGYSGFSIRELAAMVDISEAAIYRHFRSKEEIISGILDKMESFGAKLREELIQQVNTREKLDKFIMFHLNFFESLPEITSVIFSDEIFNETPSLAAKMNNIIRLRQGLLREIISTGMEEGTFVKASSDDVCLMIQGYIRLTVTKWKHSGFSFPLAERGRVFLETLDKLLFRPEMGNIVAAETYSIVNKKISTNEN